MKKKLVIFMVIISVSLLITGIIIQYSKIIKKDSNIEEQKDDELVIEYVKKLNKTIIDGGTKEQLISLLQTENILDTDIMTGKDMYLRQQPAKEIIKKNNISAYTKKAEELAQELEQNIINNFECEIEGVLEKEDYLAVLVTYKSFYYMAYINDLTAIQNKLLMKAGYDLENITDSQKQKIEIDMYKAKIKAALLLNENLDDYKNNNETKRVYVNFDGKTIENNSQYYLSYLMNLEGYTYELQGYFDTEEKINEYLNQFDLTEPLKL